MARETMGGVQSVERAFGLLEFLSRSEEVGVRSGAQPVALDPELAVIRPPQRPDPKIQPGPEIPDALHRRERIGPLALPFLEELVRVSQEAANLTIMERHSTMYIEQVAPQRMLRIFTKPGNRVRCRASVWAGR